MIRNRGEGRGTEAVAEDNFFGLSALVRRGIIWSPAQCRVGRVIIRDWNGGYPECPLELRYLKGLHQAAGGRIGGFCAWCWFCARTQI